MLVTIDKLTEPTMCSLLDGTRINVELALAKVFPFQKACHPVSVQDGYVVVQPTYVWANVGHYPLPVRIDGGDKATLVVALVQRIQWLKDIILIPPMKRHPNPEAATGSRGTTSDATCTTTSATGGGAQAISTAEGEPGQETVSKDEILNCSIGTE
jgi:hypothetical protein